MLGGFGGIDSGGQTTFLNEVAPSRMTICGILGLLKILHFCFSVLLAADNCYHAVGSVGPNVMANDGVGRCVFVACQKLLFSLRDAEQSNGRSRLLIYILCER